MRRINRDAPKYLISGKVREDRHHRSFRNRAVVLGSNGTAASFGTSISIKAPVATPSRPSVAAVSMWRR